MTVRSQKRLSAQQIKDLWRRQDYQAARIDDQAQRAEAPGDPWRLELNDQERAKLRAGQPYLWRQLVERGFLTEQGYASDALQDDPRHRPQLGR